MRPPQNHESRSGNCPLETPDPRRTIPESLSEPRVNQLRLVIQEAKADPLISSGQLVAFEDAVIRGILRGSREIDIYPDCRRFEITCKSYIAYNIVNESYSNGEPRPKGDPVQLFRKYETSRYLDYLSKATFDTAEYPGQYWHWALLCQNHIIDVASRFVPVITLLPSA